MWAGSGEALREPTGSAGAPKLRAVQVSLDSATQMLKELVEEGEAHLLSA